LDLNTVHILKHELTRPQKASIPRSTEAKKGEKRIKYMYCGSTLKTN
jgi:hypothetical protein